MTGSSRVPAGAVLAAVTAEPRQDETCRVVAVVVTGANLVPRPPKGPRAARASVESKVSLGVRARLVGSHAGQNRGNSRIPCLGFNPPVDNVSDYGRRIEPQLVMPEIDSRQLDNEEHFDPDWVSRGRLPLHPSNTDKHRLPRCRAYANTSKGLRAHDGW